MPMDIGTTDATTGLTKRIYEQWKADGLFDGTDQMPEPLRSKGIAIQKKMAYGVAKSVVDEIVANASVSGSRVS